MGIGEARVPAGDLRVVVEDVSDVPAEDDVADAEPVLDMFQNLSSETNLPRKTPSMSKPPTFTLRISRPVLTLCSSNFALIAAASIA